MPPKPRCLPASRRARRVEGITEYRSPTALGCCSFPDATKPTTTVNVTYLVGSRHESYGETGMAHLLEHLMFKGTPIDRQHLPGAGPPRHALQRHDVFDRTNYFETFTATDENLDWALAMEADRMVQLVLAKKDLDTEMTVVRNEFESGENSPQRVLWERLQAAAFDWHNYGNLTIGARSDIENVDIDRLQAFYRHLLPARQRGADRRRPLRPRADARAQIAKTFGPIPKPTRTLPTLYTKEPVQDGERSVTVRRVGGTQFVAALYRTVPGAHPDVVALDALGDVMTVEPAGRLYQALVETKKATGVAKPGRSRSHDPGHIIFWAQVPIERRRRAPRATRCSPRSRACRREPITAGGGGPRARPRRSRPSTS